MKIVRKYLGLAVIGSMLFSCKGVNKGENAASANLKEAKGGRYYGGVLHLNENEFIKTLFPLNITDGISTRVSSQIYEGLFKFDQATLDLKKSLLEDYTVDATGTIYTFKLRKGVLFQDDPCFEGGKGRELTAEDVKYCFEKICTQNVNNQAFGIFSKIVKGADAYYAASQGGKKPAIELAGVRVLDTHSLQVELIQPSSVFLYNLARPFAFIYPKEAFIKYGLELRAKAVGTGPYTLSSFDDDISIILKKNHSYYGVDQFGNKLPFLDAIDIKFIKDKKTELFEFRKGNLDMIYRLPTEYIIDILEETGPQKNGEYSQYELQRKPEMATQYLSFMNKSGVFANKNFRKAISYAIDRETILNAVLNGEGFAAGIHGITPPTFSDKGYNNELVKGYTFQPDSARYFLAKAGYPNGKGFPDISLQLNADGDRNTNVAIAIQKQLKEVLNINIKTEVVPFAQLVENIMTAKVSFFRSGYQADYPSPENFLSLFYGKDVPPTLADKSFPNFIRYKNAEFDKNYEAALLAKTPAEVNAHLLAAENILMDDAPIVVLWYDEGYRLLQSNVKNFPSNPMQLRDYSEVYLEKMKKLSSK